MTATATPTPTPTPTHRPAILPTTPYDDLPQWLTLREAAAYVRCSYWTIFMAVQQGEIPHRRFGRKIIYIPKRFFCPEIAAKVPQEANDGPLSR